VSNAASEKTRTRYVYDLDDLARAHGGPCSAKIDWRGSCANGTRADGGVVSGDRAHVALLRQQRGTGVHMHACAVEQFHYVLQGTLIADIDGQILRVSVGDILHIPAGVPHGLAASAEEDAVFIGAMSVKRGVQPAAAGAGADGKTAAPDFFATAAHAWRLQPGALPAPRSARVSAGDVRYVYPIDELDHVPAGRSSAKVVPKDYVSKKSSSFGAALSGDTLHVGVIHKARGSGAKLHSHPNEQFNVVLAGKMLGEIDGSAMEVAPHGLVHMPAGVHHCTMASAEGDITVFVVKDTSHGLSGAPIDGIEDGPRYLPGFGPAK
jgi:quercetin dioxygenase-like cupin family protein